VAEEAFCLKSAPDAVYLPMAFFQYIWYGSVKINQQPNFHVKSA